MIVVYGPRETDTTGLGLCALMPSSCKIQERAGGLYQLTMVHPIDATGRWRYLATDNIIRAPAPVRETPLPFLTDASPGQTVTRSIYRVRVNTRLRLRNGPGTSHKILGRYKNGTEVVKLEEDGAWFRVTVCKGGATGWMHSGYLAYVRSETETLPGTDVPETVIETVQARDQLFRIYAADVDDASGIVQVSAMHISYDQNGNLVSGTYSPEDVPAATAVAAIKAMELQPSEFKYYCNITDTISGQYGYRSITETLLENDGIVAQTGARLVRDNYDTYILKNEVRDRGVVIRHGKNLLGAIMSVDTSDIVTRIIPEGKDKDGNPLYLPAPGYVDSPNIDNYPIVKAKKIAYDVRVGDKEGQFETVELAQAELQRLAELEFAENAVDMPAVGLDVDFLQLSESAWSEGIDYAKLQQVHLYDTVRVAAKRSNIDARLRCIEYEYDCLMHRYDMMRLGDPVEITSTVSGYDIASGTVSGNKLIMNSVDGNAMRDMSIEYAKITSAAIEMLAADALIAVSAHINKLVAGEIEANQLYADLAEIVTATITTANIDWANIENLTAQIAAITKAEIGEAQIEYAQIKDIDAEILKAVKAEVGDLTVGDLTVDGAQIKDATITNAKIANGTIETAKIALGAITTALIATGAIGTAQIADGSITDAKIVSLNADVIKTGTLSVDRLLLKGANGLYHAINATDAGLTSTQLSQEQYQNAISGGVLVARSVTADKIAAKSITANEMAAGSITTAELAANSVTAAKIKAGEITVSHVASNFGEQLDLSSNTGINLKVSQATDAADDAKLFASTALDMAVTNDEKVGQLEQRVNAAELKITDDAIVSTVTSSAAYKSDVESIAQSKAEPALDAADAAQQVAEDAAKGAAEASEAAKKAQQDIDNSSLMVHALETRMTQTAEGLSIVRTETLPGLDGRLKTLESGVHIEGAEIGIWKEGSPFRNTITNSGWTISENDAPVITCAETKLTAPRVQTTDALMIGGLAWKVGGDGHVRLLKYGR